MSDTFTPDFAAIGQAPPVWNAKRPLRIAILGDFGAGAGRGRLQTGAELAERKPLKVEFDTLEDAMRRLGLSLTLPLGADGVPVAIELADLDAFHPDAIYAEVPVFADLASLRKRLNQTGQFAAASAEVMAWAENAGPRASSLARKAAARGSALARRDPRRLRASDRPGVRRREGRRRSRQPAAARRRPVRAGGGEPEQGRARRRGGLGLERCDARAAPSPRLPDQRIPVARCRFRVAQARDRPPIAGAPARHQRRGVRCRPERRRGPRRIGPLQAARRCAVAGCRRRLHLRRRLLPARRHAAARGIARPRRAGRRARRRLAARRHQHRSLHRSERAAASPRPGGLRRAARAAGSVVPRPVRSALPAAPPVRQEERPDLGIRLRGVQPRGRPARHALGPPGAAGADRAGPDTARRWPSRTCRSTTMSTRTAIRWPCRARTG